MTLHTMYMYMYYVHVYYMYMYMEYIVDFKLVYVHVQIVMQYNVTCLQN